ncbi:MAG: ATP-binding cassette domain-containing protein [Saprospiraceae bacterium]
MSIPTLELLDVQIQVADKTILKDINLQLFEGDQLAITGPSGSGKTTLAKAIAGKIYYQGKIKFNSSIAKGICYVGQQHQFANKSNTYDFYYQQRFNALDADDALTVREVLLGSLKEVEDITCMMHLNHLLDEPLLHLSNGEHKKLQLSKLLLNHPSVMILDSPFDGLDTSSRLDLHQCLNQLMQQGIFIILVTTLSEIPNGITKVLELEHGQVKQLKDHLLNQPVIQFPSKKLFNESLLLKLTTDEDVSNVDQVIAMKDVSITYRTKKILDHISWNVHQGEKWLLLGPNGSGKSTLLSLVTGDNPQAYANDIVLFDRPRGSGESIWDIKKKIGYLSPELHMFFDRSFTVFETIASGWFDSIGLFQKLTPKQYAITMDWLVLSEYISSKDKRLYELSFGEQRMVLLLRAFVKNPMLLILDEPGQGLNPEQHIALMNLLDAVCMKTKKTLILVTHYAEYIPFCIDHYLKLDQGVMIDKNHIQELN